MCVCRRGRREIAVPTTNAFVTTTDAGGKQEID